MIEAITIEKKEEIFLFLKNIWDKEVNKDLQKKKEDFLESNMKYCEEDWKIIWCIQYKILDKKKLSDKSAIIPETIDNWEIFIYRVGVLENQRGKWLWTNMINEVIKESKQKGFPSIIMYWVESAIKLYESLGFQLTGNTCRKWYPQMRIYL